MTETSGEQTAWRAPASGFTGQGAFGLALRVHQALVAGEQSAWVYWQMSDGSAVAEQTLTDDTLQANSPKYVALKHYARYIRPGGQRAPVTVSGSTDVVASAYVNAATGSLTWVILNGSASTQSITIEIPGTAAASYDLVRSRDGSLWQASTLQPSSAQLAFSLAGYGVATVSASTGAPDLIFANGFE